ncbi:helix-turn-helix transcriptional regulator [Gulosibacter molinativorax]|uniref:Transcriptional regulator n=1 Tax=Gulosibacter molinativorax TaxID=256821 RepID=A0ABT7CAK0_9MICO|nr:helix-turn-helix domain-containing protein [Gulosibacter molinativorax]MDJ1371671.1 transcriptional regulator [Gulosibacter molinativorax]QUY63093.1 Transcriptional regulator [Gulosibacter molinativorax]
MTNVDPINAVGSLADPIRRALYEYVVAQPDPVGREEVANAVEIPPHKAKFHLDRLVQEGLLESEYRRLTGKTGPGAGRPAKVYRRGDTPVEVSLPGRRYALVGGILASAIEHAGLTPELQDALQHTAREAGEQTGRGASGATPADAAQKERQETEAIIETLTSDGYEPIQTEDAIRLRNCPFHDLSSTHRDLVCGINEAYVSGMLDGLGCAGSRASLEPTEGLCCVAIRPVATGPDRGADAETD